MHRTLYYLFQCKKISFFNLRVLYTILLDNLTYNEFNRFVKKCFVLWWVLSSWASYILLKYSDILFSILLKRFRCKRRMERIHGNELPWLCPVVQFILQGILLFLVPWGKKNFVSGVCENYFRVFVFAGDKNFFAVLIR